MRIKKAAVWFLCCVLLVPVLLPAAAAAEEEPLGTLGYFLSGEDDEGHRSCESDLGSFVADAMRFSSGADIALLPTGDLGENLQAGAVYPTDLERALPNNSPLVTVTVTGRELCAILNLGVATVELLETERINWDKAEFDGYLHVSGIRVTYDYSSLPGERIYRITDEEGAVIQIDDLASFTLVTTRSLIEGAYGDAGAAFSDVQDAGTEREAVTEYLVNGGEVGQPTGGRIKVIGTTEYTLIRRMPWWYLVLLVVLFAGFSGFRGYKNKMKYER